MGTGALSPHVASNRRYWNDLAAWFAMRARRHWQAPEPEWGIWNIPQSQLPILPADVAGQFAVELGCGTAYVSAWLARLGAHPVGVDITTGQLATARAMQVEFGLHFPLLQADAEQLPIRDGCADLAISEYGAALWCDPHRWIPEAARLLRRGGRLIVFSWSTLLQLCQTDDGSVGDTLVRDLFGLHQLARPDREGVEFGISHGQMIRLLRTNGLVVDDLIEVAAPSDAASDFAQDLPLSWARRWPAEEAWLAHRP